MNAHQGTYVDGTATKLAAHCWLQSLCHFFGANGPAHCHELMSCCINWGHSTIITERTETTTTGNEEQPRDARELSPTDKIHTFIERLLQQLSTAVAAGTGKKHWSTTSKTDQMSCQNCTSSSRLASRFNFSWDVITTRRYRSSYNNASAKIKHLPTCQT